MLEPVGIRAESFVIDEWFDREYPAEPNPQLFASRSRKNDAAVGAMKRTVGRKARRMSSQQPRGRIVSKDCIDLRGESRETELEQRRCDASTFPGPSAFE